MKTIAFRRILWKESEVLFMSARLINDVYRLLLGKRISDLFITTTNVWSFNGLLSGQLENTVKNNQI